MGDHWSKHRPQSENKLIRTIENLRAKCASCTKISLCEIDEFTNGPKRVWSGARGKNAYVPHRSPLKLHACTKRTFVHMTLIGEKKDALWLLPKTYIPYRYRSLMENSFKKKERFFYFEILNNSQSRIIHICGGGKVKAQAEGESLKHKT